MGLSKRQILETSLFDSEQVVTVQYLSRHAEIPIDDAKDELNEFLKNNKNRTELHAVYILSGILKMKGNSTSTGSCDTSEEGITLKRRTQLVRDCHLEKVQQNYEEIETCEIYGLFAKPVKTLCLLYSVDSMEDEEFERTDSKRSWLSYPHTETMDQETAIFQNSTHISDELVSGNNSILSASKHAKTEPKLSKQPITKIKNDTAFKIEQAVKNKRKKEVEADTAFKSSKKSADAVGGNVSASIFVKRRGPRVLIDDEELEVNEKIVCEKAGEANIRKNSGKLVSAEKSSSVVTNKIVLSQDDLFSDGDSTPERMEVDENVNNKNQDKAKSEKQSHGRSCISSNPENDLPNRNEPQENLRKPTRKEYVTETFLDSDGFMVTKQVLKEIEIVQPKLSEACNKSTSDAGLLNSKSRTNVKVPQVQAKISSFFKKK